MKLTGNHNYYVYIVTNKNKTVLYTGVTNNLLTRIQQHKTSVENNANNFTARYNAYNLVYYEHFININDAIAWEKTIKGWVRTKKIALINEFNPEWQFLNDEIT